MLTFLFTFVLSEDIRGAFFFLKLIIILAAICLRSFSRSHILMFFLLLLLQHAPSFAIDEPSHVKNYLVERTEVLLLAIQLSLAILILFSDNTLVLVALQVSRA